MQRFDIDLAEKLHAEAPGRLAQAALEQREGFIFEPRDMRADEGGWGGELRVCLNQNVVLHFVPAFSEEMATLAELPQFAVMPSPDVDLAGEAEVHTYEGGADLDPFDGVLFKVTPGLYESMRDELADLARRFAGRCLLADKWFPLSRFTPFIGETVLGHKVLVAERPFDFKKRDF